MVYLGSFLLLLWTASSAAPFIQVNPDNQLFVDPQGRTRIFHGVNAVYKLAPWVPATDVWDCNNSMTDKDFDDLRSWGFNAVRLGVMWPGVEPVLGQFNLTYLAQIQKIVDGLFQRNIYTILDFHQDIFNRETCGEGVPDWAYATDSSVAAFPEPVAPAYPTDGNKYPDINQCLNKSFSAYYLSAAVSNAFQLFYDGKTNSRNEFVNGFWPTVAQYFSSSQGVLGYEIINEPWCGDIYADPRRLLEDGYADATNLQPLYKDVHDSIRTKDDQHILFYESSVSNYYTTGLKQGPGGVSYNDRQAYSYHVYCGPTNGTGDPRYPFECDAVDQIFVNSKMKDVQTLGNGAFMTEFGAMLDSSAAEKVLTFLLDLADTHLQSWSYWEYKSFQDITTVSPYGESFYYADGTLQQAKVKYLSRTYAYAIAGVPSSMKFNANTAVFTLVYSADTTVQAQTEIYLNQAWWYPNGFIVFLSPAGTSWKSIETNYISITHPSNITPGQNVTVTISPK